MPRASPEKEATPRAEFINPEFSEEQQPKITLESSLGMEELPPQPKSSPNRNEQELFASG